MSAGDVAAIVISVAIGMAAVGFLFTMGAAIRAIGTFRRSVEEITSRTIPLIADMHAGIKQANSDLLRVDELLDTAESISSTVDSASRLAYTAISNPLVKGLSAGAGIAGAYRGFFRRRRRKSR